MLFGGCRLLLCAVLLFPCFSLAQSEKPKEQPPPQQGKSSALDKGAENAPLVAGGVNYPSQKAEANKYKADGAGEFLESLFTTVDGLTFWVLVIQSFFLWWTITAMRKSDERQLRPWVSFRICGISQILQNKPINFTFTCTNHGQSPARRLGLRAVISFIEKAEKYTPPVIAGDWNEDRMDVFPNVDIPDGEKPIMHCGTGYIPTPEQVERAARGTHVFLMGVELGYRDVYSSEVHKTRECMVIQPLPDGVQFNIVPGSGLIT